MKITGFPGDSCGKESACNVGDLSSIPGPGRSPGEGNDYPLQYSCLKNLMERGAWQATFHGVPKESDTTKWLTLSLFLRLWWKSYIYLFLMVDIIFLEDILFQKTQKQKKCLQILAHLKEIIYIFKQRNCTAFLMVKT